MRDSIPQNPLRPFIKGGKGAHLSVRRILIRGGWSRSGGWGLSVRIVNAAAIPQALLPALASSLALTLALLTGLVHSLTLAGLIHRTGATAALPATAAPTLGRGDIGAGQTEGKECGQKTIEPLLAFHVKISFGFYDIMQVCCLLRLITGIRG